LIYKTNDRGRLEKFEFSDNKGAYQVIQPMMLDIFLESIKKNEVIPDLDKLDQLEKLNEESNPIIFFYEFL